jgi:hypothetical protein
MVGKPQVVGNHATVKIDIRVLIDRYMGADYLLKGLVVVCG